MNNLEATTYLNTTNKCYLGPSKIHGVGVFALFDLSKGTKLYADEVAKVFHVSPGNLSKLFPEIKNMIIEQWPRAKVDGRFVWPTTRWVAYMNHSEDPNYSGMTDTLLRDVRKGEEITENYCNITGAEEVFPWLKCEDLSTSA